ncbi:MAG TPA: phosphatase PAP2 family protein [Bacteroidota bacterium]|nr:phosphatase PAP2 family protein [Bacteroidota bacterium]
MLIDFLYKVDLGLFRFINGTLQNPVFDAFFPFITDLNRIRLVLYAVILILLWMLVHKSKTTRLAALLLILTILIGDQLNSFVIKFILERTRPCHSLVHVHLLVGCGSGYSFPSSHAVNNFAGALILAYFFPRGKWWLFGFASLVAFSRIYVGVHYPSDVAGGAVIGLSIASAVLFFAYLVEQSWHRFISPKKKSTRD